MANWDQIKTQYEILHDSIENIVSEHDISQRVLETVIEEENWVRKKVSEEDINDAEKFNSVASTFLDPEITKLRYAVLTKLRDVLANVTEAHELKYVADLLTSLQPSVKFRNNKEEKKNEIKILVMNQYGEKPQSIEHVKYNRPTDDICIDVGL